MIAELERQVGLLANIVIVETLAIIALAALVAFLARCRRRERNALTGRRRAP